MAEMKIVTKKIKDLIPYENNPRRNDKAVEAVMNSIKEFGFQSPIIIDKNNVIISGHTRRLAAIRLKMTEVPCYIAEDLTEEQAKAFRLADNRVASFATWDEAKLSKEISSILNIDLSDYGFKKESINEIFRENAEIKTHICPKCNYEWQG